MSYARLIPASILATLALAAPADAADPIMPLGDVRPGMQCTGYSVIQGTEPVPFDVKVEDVVDGAPTVGAPRILISVSGAAVDRTGLGPGFSGSPVYCSDGAGTSRVIGAVSESVGEYGGKVALATPIQSVLGVPVRAPSDAGTVRSSRIRPLAGPLTISGLSAPLARRVNTLARRNGSGLIATPAGSAGSFPARSMRPGSAVSVGLSGGDLRMSAIGTVAYVDGPHVWAFGHEMDALGERSLMLQDAYVHRVINNPNHDLYPTYKYASAGRTIGKVTNDGFAAVTGTTASTPPSIPVSVYATDVDTARKTAFEAQSADESRIGNPYGSSIVSIVAPVVGAEGVLQALGSAPPNVTARACTRVAVKQLPRPLRFCNRYVAESTRGSQESSLTVPMAVGTDIASVLWMIDSYDASRIDVTSVTTDVKVSRGADIATLRAISLPKRAKAGQTVKAKIRIQRWRRKPESRIVKIKLPRDLSRGSHKIRFRGTGSDDPNFDDQFLDVGDFPQDSPEEPPTPDTPDLSRREALASLYFGTRALQRYDGVTGQSRRRGDLIRFNAFNPEDVRVSGQATARIRIVKR